MNETDALLEAVREGEDRVIARAITAIENRSELGTGLAQALELLSPSIRTMGVTGPPGAGKSSLINALVEHLQPHYRRIGILTVDPSSPVSGGAVLGDRVRMAKHSANPEVFIRSLAARGHLGGVTRTTQAVIDLLAAGGMDLVIVETVGTGQSEVEVAELTDIKIVVSAPGMGDEMQAIKAGVLEIADLLVVNKADLLDADRTANFLKSMLMHRGHDERRTLLKVSATEHDGLAELAEAICARLGEPRPPKRTAKDARARLARAVGELAVQSLQDIADPRVDELVRKLSAGEILKHDAAAEALRIIAASEPAEIETFGSNT